MNFDGLARSYRLLETVSFGNALQRCRTTLIPALTTPRRALIIGEGDGRFLCEFLRHHPSAEVDCIDLSARMLELAQDRAAREVPVSRGRVRFIQTPIETWRAEPPYDLIVTHFFLDCFERAAVAKIVGKLGASAAPNAEWLLGDFRIPDRMAARWHARLWLSLMYGFFGAVTNIEPRQLVDPTPHLRANGFICAQSRISHFGMLKAELWHRTPTNTFRARSPATRLCECSTGCGVHV